MLCNRCEKAPNAHQLNWKTLSSKEYELTSILLCNSEKSQSHGLLQIPHLHIHNFAWNKKIPCFIICKPFSKKFEKSEPAVKVGVKTNEVLGLNLRVCSGESHRFDIFWNSIWPQQVENQHLSSITYIYYFLNLNVDHIVPYRKLSDWHVKLDHNLSINRPREYQKII